MQKEDEKDHVRARGEHGSKGEQRRAEESKGDRRRQTQREEGETHPRFLCPGAESVAAAGRGESRGNKRGVGDVRRAAPSWSHVHRSDYRRQPSYPSARSSMSSTLSHSNASRTVPSHSEHPVSLPARTPLAEKREQGRNLPFFPFVLPPGRSCLNPCAFCPMSLSLRFS